MGLGLGLYQARPTGSASADLGPKLAWQLFATIGAAVGGFGATGLKIIWQSYC
jgi:hypothetical protein